MITEEDKDKLIATLTLQLREKEEQITKFMDREIENEKQLEKQASIHCEHLKEVILKIDQDKISFCIEKFQETKKSLRDKVCLMENDEHCYPQNAIHWQDVVAIIDNQIASLKKEMK